MTSAEAPDPVAAPVVAVIDACVFPRTRDWLIPITDRALDGLIRPIWSPSIIAEANRVLTWLWLKRHGGQQTEAAWRQCSAAARTMFAALTPVFRVVDDCPPAMALWTDEPPDAWDAPLWTAAMRAAATFIVTANLADGPPPDPDGVQEYGGVIIVHPIPFLTLIDQVTDVDDDDRAWSAGHGSLTQPGSPLRARLARILQGV